MSLHSFCRRDQKGSGFGCRHSTAPHESLAGQFARTSLRWSHRSSLSPLPCDTLGHNEWHNEWNIVERNAEVGTGKWFLIFEDPSVDIDLGDCWHYLTLKITHRCNIVELSSQVCGLYAFVSILRHSDHSVFLCLSMFFYVFLCLSAYQPRV